MTKSILSLCAILLVGTSFIFLSSCSKDDPNIEPVPVDTTDTDTVDDDLPDRELHYLETAEGVADVMAQAYSGYHDLYGREDAMYMGVFGTDEFEEGSQITKHPLHVYTVTPATRGLDLRWTTAYITINNCNGLIQYVPTAEISDSEKTRIIAEARYIRAHMYFILVRTFGGVTLFNDYITDFAGYPPGARETDEIIYQAITGDLRKSIDGLPVVRQVLGRPSQSSAIHLLADVYLTRGWKGYVSTDFDSALHYANELILNQGKYGVALLNDYGDVHAEGQENNSEVIFAIESWPTSDPSVLGHNGSNFYFRPFYEQIDGLVRDMTYGRPYIRFKPSSYLLYEAFRSMDLAYQEIDSRFVKTFQTIWFANSDENSDDGMVIGDTALWMPNFEMTEEEINSYAPARVLPPSLLTKEFYPSLTKYDDTNRSHHNDASTRPFIVHKFSETYLIAAEAYYKKSDPTNAAAMLNVIRERAAWDGKENEIRITSGDVTIDFILDERSRELAGESMRWYDLVRTNKLEDRNVHNPDVTAIESYHVLRPIPQQHIDAVPGYGQNTGYF